LRRGSSFSSFLLRASSGGRRRKRGGVAGGRRVPWPLVADGGERSLGRLVQTPKFVDLLSEVRNCSSIPRALHALAECQGSVLSDIDFVGAARGGVVDGERRGGSVFNVRACHRTLARAVLPTCFPAGEALSVEVIQTTKGNILPRFLFGGIRRVAARRLMQADLLVAKVAAH
jgi:hypothetical protein